MADIYERAERLIGQAGQQRLAAAHVAVAGIGGVGSFVAEALARAGIGTLTLIDHDCIDVTNINRQLHALHSTVGRPKATVMAERIRDINPDLTVITKETFITADNCAGLLDGRYDYIVDAVDNVTAKLALVLTARERDIPVICSMGTANKLDNQSFELADISQTRVCPLARVMRRELKKRGISSGVQVVYSPAEVVCAAKSADGGQRPVPGSISYVPGTAGLYVAGVVVQGLLAVAQKNI